MTILIKCQNLIGPQIDITPSACGSSGRHERHISVVHVCTLGHYMCHIIVRDEIQRNLVRVGSGALATQYLHIPRCLNVIGNATDAQHATRRCLRAVGEGHCYKPN